MSPGELYPDAAADFSARERLSTGIAELDEILGGGYRMHSINVIMGEPGSGKTVLAEQILFRNASDDRPSIYITTLSEPAAKVVGYLQDFRFFDASKIGTSILYEDLGAALAAGGPRVLVDRIRELIKTASPKLIVVDSFKALHDLEPSSAEMRRLVSELAGLLSAYDITAFLVGEYVSRNFSHFPEFAVADSILQLLRRRLGTRDERYLRVLKLRGSDYRQGLHAFRISERGLVVHPRLVTPPAPQVYEPILERVTTGVPGLDPLLAGGLWRGSSTVLAGPTGSGKTTLAMQFVLEGVRQGEPGLYLNLQENPTQLGRLIRSLGEKPDQIKNEGLSLFYASPVELQIDSIINELFRRIEQNGVRRLVVDALGELSAAATNRQRLHDYLYALVQHLTSSRITSLLVFETLENRLTGTAELELRFSYMADNIILLRHEYDEQTARTLRVVKSRGSAHDQRAHELVIGPTGIRVD